MLTLFRNCPHAKINICPHSTVFTEQEKCARSKSELNYKKTFVTSMLQITEGIQKITQTLNFFKAAEENYGDE